MDDGAGAEKIRPELFEQTLFPLRAPAQLEHRHPARAEHEGGELLRLPQAPRPQGFQRREDDLLRQVVRGVRVSQVTQTIEPNARSHPAEQLGFGLAVGAGADSKHQLRIAQFNFHHTQSYV